MTALDDAIKSKLEQKSAAFTAAFNPAKFERQATEYASARYPQAPTAAVKSFAANYRRYCVWAAERGLTVPTPHTFFVTDAYRDEDFA